ncbi:MAG: hypothetical protein WC119_00745 [Synergistaceae bacterium]
MSRIDVLPSDKKGKFRVLVDFIQRGVAYSSPISANREAETLSKKMPRAELHLAEIVTEIVK